MNRQSYIEQISKAFSSHNVVTLLGPRQCGKTTLARDFIKQHSDFPAENYFDLEDYVDLERLSQPQLALSNLEGLIVIDEVQRKPDLFQALRMLVDKPKNNQKFLLLGGASRHLLKQSSETLTGRIIYLELTPFNLREVNEAETLFQRGGFPKSFLAKSDEDSFIWRKSYIRTFLEQDLPSLDINVSPLQLRRFWMMLANYHGQSYNGMELSRSLNISYNKVKQYTDILTSTLMIRQLQPWFENISKRQVKSPKVYFRDCGIYHTLLGLGSKPDLLKSPKLGASWEGFALEEIIRFHNAEDIECFFWATQSSAELDLLILQNGKKLGFEFKYSDAPKLTKSMKIAIEDLKLDQLVVIYPGSKDYFLTKEIKVMSLLSYLTSSCKSVK